MKRLTTAFCVSLLLATSPAWAGGGHGKHGDKGRDKHAEKEWKHERKAWAKYEKHERKHGHAYGPRYYDERQVVQNHYYPVPAPAPRYYVDAVPYSPPPGVYVNLPNVYIPY